MATYDGLTTPSPLITAATAGARKGLTTYAVTYEAARSYSFAPDLNAGNRPTSGQIYPRGVR